MAATRWTLSSLPALSVLALLISAAPSSAAPPPEPPPPPLYPPAPLLIPNKLAQPFGVQNPLVLFPQAPPPAANDARGVGIGTNADLGQPPGQPIVGMPGSRLGITPVRIGPFGPLPGVRTGDTTAGVGVGITDVPPGLEDPHGKASPSPLPGNEAVLAPPPPGYGYAGPG